MCVLQVWGGQGLMPGVREVGQESVAHMGDAATDTEAVGVRGQRQCRMDLERSLRGKIIRTGLKTL